MLCSERRINVLSISLYIFHICLYIAVGEKKSLRDKVFSRIWPTFFLTNTGLAIFLCAVFIGEETQI